MRGSKQRKSDMNITHASNREPRIVGMSSWTGDVLN
jgi:hypothetical protein